MTRSDPLRLEGRTLRVDLSGVTFMDSTSLNMPLGRRLRAQAGRGTLELCAHPVAPGLVGARC